jgi:hypothetical protein
MNSVVPTHGVSHRHFADARGLASAARISLAFCSSVAGFLLASCWRFARLALCFALRSPDVQTWQTGNARPVDRPRHSRDRCALACVVVAAGLRPVVRLWSVALLNRKVRPLFPAPCSLLSALPLLDPQQQLQIRFVRQLFCRCVVPFHMYNVHVLEICKLSCDRANRLPALHTNLLPFCECHARSVWHFLPGHNGPGVSKSYSP